jgi:hypothetical protein
MRDTIANITIPTIRSSLEVVRNQFEGWRKGRASRGIPEALWEAAVELCRDHSIFAVSRALRLNYNGLKDRVLRARDVDLAVGKRSGLGFVKLDLAAPITPSECLVEMEAPNGAKMRMSLKGPSREFDPVELSRAFWRQGE